MPDFSIIVPAFNEEEYLAQTIASIRTAMQGLEETGELIVVDNNSTDRTADVARENGADKVVFEPHNQIAKARNAGAAEANSDNFVFVDADSHPSSEMLRQALDFLQSGEVVGGGARVEMDGAVSPTVAWITRNWNAVSERFNYAAGSFFFCRRDAFELVGGFDESVYAGEEVWLARRLKKWARRNGMRFEILKGVSVVTSARKSDWFSTWDFVKQLGLIFLFPWATRSRRLCAIWYRRP
ncbi:MAG: glycosyl transferase family 2 [Verrucomicrobiales bacterium]|nr:glycosyl transferase family 2 [Verrucomicrobiales bacterium]